LAAEHGELVTQHQDLQVLGAIASGQQGEQPDRPAQRQVGDLRQHQGDLCGVMVEASQYRPQPSANSQLTSYNRVSAPHGPGTRTGSQRLGGRCLLVDPFQRQRPDRRHPPLVTLLIVGQLIQAEQRRARPLTSARYSSILTWVSSR
jgi:hypothetical protein